MNDYILKLAKEHFCRTEYDNGSTHECYEFSETELKEFAELIVQECMELVDGYTKIRTHTTYYDAVAQIEQQFGVKFEDKE
jgi:hypothetical protein